MVHEQVANQAKQIAFTDIQYTIELHNGQHYFATITAFTNFTAFHKTFFVKRHTALCMCVCVWPSKQLNDHVIVCHLRKSCLHDKTLWMNKMKAVSLSPTCRQGLMHSPPHQCPCLNTISLSAGVICCLFGEQVICGLYGKGFVQLLQK